MDVIASSLLTGLGQGSVIFLVAVGLSLQIGVMRILNIANGAFFMLGAYFAVSVFGDQSIGPVQVFTALLAACLLTALCGAVAEVTVIRRLYDRPGLYPFLGTFAILLIIQGLVIATYGQLGRSSMRSTVFGHVFTVGGLDVSVYNLFLILVACLIALGLSRMIHKTTLGRKIVAAAVDRDMAAMLGIDVRGVYLGMLVLSALLAGLAGGLVSPLVELTPNMAITLLIEAFAVVVIGGSGSIGGTLMASMAVGVMQSVLIRYVPEVADLSIYVLMAVVMVVRPQGLLGRRELGVA